MSEPVRRMLVAYDIVEDRRRDRVAVALQEHGERLQYSVFVVDGRPASFVRLKAKLAGLIDTDSDAIMFCDLGPRETAIQRVISHIGVQRRPASDDDALIQLDMSEFHDRYTVSRLVGAPPGYVGYDEGGQLTEKVRRKPFSVVLFDEVEKAHPDVFNTPLQVLEDGRLTDGQGRIVDFKNTVLILTTNLGTKDVSKAVGLGFAASSDEASNYDRMKQKVNDELKQHFRPEFLNRIDDIIVFHQLTQEEIVSIVDLMVARLDVQLRNKDMGLEITEKAKLLLATKGYDPVLGARPLRRTIQREIEDALSEKILFGELSPGQIVVVDTTPEDPMKKAEPGKDVPEMYGKFANVSPSVVDQLRTKFTPKSAVALNRMSGLDVTMRQAVEAKRLNAPLSPDQQKGLLAPMKDLNP